MENFITYEIGKISVVLPKEHLLDVYQATHPLYNRFQGFLAKNLPSKSTVVEVGANIGDVMVNVFQFNRSIDYIAIEGDPLFFEYLCINSEILNKELCLEQVQTHLVNEFIADKLVFSSFTGTGGTRSGNLANDESDYFETKKLDDILLSLRVKKVDLLMVDVDGFDFDVIDSSKETLSRDKPMLFFEMSLLTEHQVEEYLKMIRGLKIMGYERISVLDNFGNLIFKNCNMDSLRDLSSYALRQNLGIGTRTIYYLDILMSHQKNSDLHVAIINEYAMITTESF